MNGGYLPLITGLRRNILKRAVKDIRPFSKKFDAIAISGASGFLIGPSLADILGKKLIIVRKGGERPHGFVVEFSDICENYLIVDDIINTGNTIKRIIKTIKQQLNNKPDLYSYLSDYPPQPFGAYIYSQLSCRTSDLKLPEDFVIVYRSANKED